MKLKGTHFDTNEVIKAELQVVLNTLTGHLKMAEVLGPVHMRGRGLFQG
jgi:hypothetical protein